MRLALLSAVLSVVAVFGAALPLLLEAEHRERALNEQIVAAAILGAAAGVDDDEELAALVERAALRGAALVHQGQVAARAGVISAEEERALGRCIPSGVNHLRVISLDEALGVCAQIAGSGDTLLAVTAPARTPAGSRTRRVLVLTLAFACLTAAVLGGAIRRLLAPLGDITAAARDLAHGLPAPQLAAVDDPDLRPLAEALRQLNDALAAREDDIQQRLDLTQQLAAVVAHEVRNPLQSLTMLADVVAHSEDAGERQELLAAIQQELTLIEVVVQRLVGSGDRLRLVRRTTSLSALLGRCARLQGPEARAAGVSLETELSLETEAELDGPLLRRAVENLLRNAVSMLKARGGGVVRLSAERDGGLVHVHVDDDGEGVPVDRREQIFRSGITGRPGGTGLGLPMARMVAEAHGGTLDVSEAPLGGARFTLTLPLSPPEPSP